MQCGVQMNVVLKLGLSRRFTSDFSHLVTQVNMHFTVAVDLFWSHTGTSHRFLKIPSF